MGIESFDYMKSVELIQGSLPYINLDPDETDPFTLVMNYRFWVGLHYFQITWDEKYWKVPSHWLPNARKALAIHKSIEHRFACIDWSWYIGKYGVDARNFSYPAAVWNVPAPRNVKKQSNGTKENTADFSGYKTELDRKDEIIRKLKERCLTLERQYNEAVSGNKNK